MSQAIPQPNILAVILSGGTGARLYPLTKLRAKPAVPIGGKYRLVDIPISNCLNSGIDQIYVLTQFNSVSLHRHITRTYRFDLFSHGWVQILAAEQTPSNRDWYQGTADAVRKQLSELRALDTREYLILSSDHLYRMDYSAFIHAHRKYDADITVSVTPTSRLNALRFGIVQTDPSQRIIDYREKPSDPAQLADLVSFPNSDRPYLASMGIYIFRAEVLHQLLETSTGSDFSKHILPPSLMHYDVRAYKFDGYWEDIGTIRNYYEANIGLTHPEPSFSFYDPEHPMYSYPEILPATHLDQGSTLDRTLLADGCRIVRSEICESVIGLRSMIGPNAKLSRVIMLGADYYETDSQQTANRGRGIPHLGIGPDCTIEAAIIDRNSRIGSGVVIRNLPERPDTETEHYVSRDGIVVVPKNTVIPPGTLI
jgi:glucose-1-phosphate adenylyltransferase